MSEQDFEFVDRSEYHCNREVCHCINRKSCANRFERILKWMQIPQRSLSQEVCNPNVVDKNGNTLLHSATTIFGNESSADDESNESNKPLSLWNPARTHWENTVALYNRICTLTLVHGLDVRTRNCRGETASEQLQKASNLSYYNVNNSNNSNNDFSLFFFFPGKPLSENKSNEVPKFILKRIKKWRETNLTHGLYRPPKIEQFLQLAQAHNPTDFEEQKEKTSAASADPINFCETFEMLNAVAKIEKLYRREIAKTFFERRSLISSVGALVIEYTPTLPAVDRRKNPAIVKLLRHNQLKWQPKKQLGWWWQMNANMPRAIPLAGHDFFNATPVTAVTTVAAGPRIETATTTATNNDNLVGRIWTPQMSQHIEDISTRQRQIDLATKSTREEKSLISAVLVNVWVGLADAMLKTFFPKVIETIKAIQNKSSKPMTATNSESTPANNL